MGTWWIEDPCGNSDGPGVDPFSGEPIVIPDGHTPPDNKVDKDTNPKDAIGSNKLPIGLVPSSGINFATLAFLEGASKYGRYNWRVAGVRVSIYYDAVMRHLEKYWNGEWEDPVTKVPHLSSALACLMIIIDAKQCGKLNDDRPPACLEISKDIDRLSETVVHLKELFKEHHPHQYTIADTLKNPNQR